MQNQIPMMNNRMNPAMAVHMNPMYGNMHQGGNMPMAGMNMQQVPMNPAGMGPEAAYPNMRRNSGGRSGFLMLLLFFLI